MADKNAEVAVEGNGGMKKTLSLWNFFTIGFGAIIGTGWVLQVGDWMVVGGGPVPAMIAFLLGAIFLVPVGAVFGELTAAIPISGGIVEYVDRSFGRTLSYITGWLLALGNGILCPWEAIAISTLVSEMFGSLPGLEWLRAVKLYTILGADVYLFPTLIALGFAVYVIFLNFRGASSAAKLQAFLTKALLCGMLLAMGVSLFTGSPDNAMPVFSQVAGAGGGKAATESTSLFAGIVSVLVLTPFFYAGFDTELLSRLRKQPRASTGTSSARSSPWPCWPPAASTWSASTRSAPSSTGMSLLRARFPRLPASRVSTCSCTWPCSSSPRLDP